MATLEIDNRQVAELVRQLPAEDRIEVMIALREGAPYDEERLLAQGRAAMRRTCAERGLDFDCLTDEERLRVVDDAVHEDRDCR